MEGVRYRRQDLARILLSDHTQERLGLHKLGLPSNPKTLGMCFGPS